MLTVEQSLFGMLVVAGIGRGDVDQMDQGVLQKLLPGAIRPAEVVFHREALGLFQGTS